MFSVTPTQRSQNTKASSYFGLLSDEPAKTAAPGRTGVVSPLVNPSAPSPGSYAAGLPTHAATDNPEMLAYALLQGAAHNTNQTYGRTQSQTQMSQQVSDNNLRQMLGTEAASTASASGQNSQELFHKQVDTKFGEDTADWALDNTVHEKQYNLAADIANKAIDNEHALSKKAAEAMRVQ